MTNNCRACAYWDWVSLNPEAESLRDITGEDFGYCRFNAPRPLVIPSGEDPPDRTNTLWPETAPTDWCADFKEEEYSTKLTAAFGLPPPQIEIITVE